MEEETAENSDVVVSVAKILLILTYRFRSADYLEASCSRLVNITSLPHEPKRTFGLKSRAVNSAVAKKSA